MIRERGQGMKGMETKRLLRALGLGAGTSLLMIAAGCCLFALLMIKGLLRQEAAGWCAIAICAAGTIAGCTVSQKIARRGPLPVSLGTTAITMLILAAIRMLAHTGSAAVWNNAVVMSVCAAAAALIGAGRGR